MTPLAALTLSSCLAVNPAAGRITAGDLAAAIPGFTAAAPDVPVAWAPAPGVKRVFRVPELRRLAAQLGWEIAPAADVCVERPVSPPDPARLLEAMRRALPAVGIAILDYGHQPIPGGEIEFPANGLRAEPAGALWRGCVHYAGTRCFAVWARVKVLSEAERAVAAVDLRPGRAISSGDVRGEMRPELPAPSGAAVAPADVIGKWPRAAIRAGTAIVAGMLQGPREVLAGDTVTVEVRGGAAHLEMPARAEASGAVGDIIPVRNPSSHKRFPARVEGKGRVLVEVPVAGNPSEVNPSEVNP